ncbi:MAG: lactonase family protein [Gemmatimonadota bacterium]|nr:lactonase family protein [Gemmatimonadota bacterium]
MSDQSGGHVTVYVGTYTDDRTEGLHILRLDTSSGDLEAVSKVPDVHNPFFLAADAGARFLYAACAMDEFDGRPGGCIKSFAIDAESGSLALLNEQHAGGDLPCYLSVDRTGRCLLSGNYGSGSVSTLPIDEEGRVEPVAQVVRHEGSSVDSGRQEAPHVHSIVLSPDHRFAFSADLGIDKVMSYELDASSATIEPTGQGFVSTRAGAGPRHVSFHPDGSRAYVINELDSTIAVFDYDVESGSLSERQTLSALPGDYDGDNFCADVRVHPSGRFLYGSNRGHDSIVIMSIDGETGELTPLAHEPSGGAWPWNLEFDPAGEFVLAANQRGNLVSCFRIDPDTGALDPAGRPVEVPGAVCVVIPSPTVS